MRTRAPGVEQVPPSLDEAALFARFMREFGETERAELADVLGPVLVIDRGLFLNLKGEWKIVKRRARPVAALHRRQPPAAGRGLVGAGTERRAGQALLSEPV